MFGESSKQVVFLDSLAGYGHGRQSTEILLFGQGQKHPNSKRTRAHTPGNEYMGAKGLFGLEVLGEDTA